MFNFYLKNKFFICVYLWFIFLQLYRQQRHDHLLR